MKKHYLSYLFLSIIFFGCSNNYNKGSLSLTMPFYHGREEVVVEEYTPEIKFTLDFTFSDETTLHRDAVAGEEVFLPEVPVGECKIEVFGYLGEMELPVFSGLNQFIVQEGENPPVVIKLKRIEQKGDESEVVVEPEQGVETGQFIRITWNLNDGNWGDVIPADNFACPAQTIENSFNNPVKSGYTLAGWECSPNYPEVLVMSNGSNFSYVLIYPFDQNYEFTITAIWEEVVPGGEEQQVSGYEFTCSVQNLIDNGDYPVEGNVYSISTEDELRKLSTWTTTSPYYGFENVTFVLTESIELQNQFTPIGYSTDKPFMGKFDGQGNTISGLNINVTKKSSAALFGYVGVTQTVFESGWIPEIKNLIVDGEVTVSKETSAGGIVGDAYGSVIIDNCISQVNVNNTSSSNSGMRVGGICGNVPSSSITGSSVIIKNCINIGDVEGPMCIGGIVGNSINDLKISNCANYGTVTYTNEKAGGIIGGVEFTEDKPYLSVFENCFNAGLVKGPTESEDPEYPYLSYGSLIGGYTGITENHVKKLAGVITCGLYLQSTFDKVENDAYVSGFKTSDIANASVVIYEDDGATAVSRLNTNITAGILSISDAKKWSTTPATISGKTVYLFN